MTYKGKFKKVLSYNTKSYHDNFVTLKFGIYNTAKNTGNELKLTATEDQLILVKNNWIKFKHVKNGDKVKILASTCFSCNVKIPFIHQSCGNRCVGIFANKIIWADPKQHERVRHQATERMNDPKFKKLFLDSSRKAILANHDQYKLKQSERMKQWHREHPDWKPSYGFQIPEHYQRCAKIIGSNMISFPEKCVGKWLDEIGIQYHTQYPVKNGKFYNNRSYYYYLDYAITEIKLAVEIDGTQFHQDKRHDDRKRKLESLGWKIIHINAKEVIAIPETTKLKLEQELCNYLTLSNHEERYEFIEISVNNVFTKLTRNQPVYNLEIQEDNTILAKGIVVSN